MARYINNDVDNWVADQNVVRKFPNSPDWKAIGGNENWFRGTTRQPYFKPQDNAPIVYPKGKNLYQEGGSITQPTEEEQKDRKLKNLFYQYKQLNILLPTTNFEEFKTLPEGEQNKLYSLYEKMKTVL